MGTITLPTFVRPDVRKVRMTVELMDLLVVLASKAEGAKLVLDWGEPDAEGFYSPTITITNEDV